MFLFSAYVFIIIAHSSSFTKIQTQIVNIQLEHDRISFHLYLTNAKRGKIQQQLCRSESVSVLGTQSYRSYVISHSTRRIIIIISIWSISYYVCLPALNGTFVEPFMMMTTKWPVYISFGRNRLRAACRRLSFGESRMIAGRNSKIRRHRDSNNDNYF